MNGEVQAITGPMFSGKTTELVRRIRRYRQGGHKCKLVKYSKDIRSGEGESELSTHDKMREPAEPHESLSTLDVTGCTVVGVDEGQFFEGIAELLGAGPRIIREILQEDSLGLEPTEEPPRAGQARQRTPEANSIETAERP